MRFVMLMIPAIYQGEGPPDGFAPPAGAVERMMRFNEELANAGILIALDGFFPPAQAARICFSSVSPSVQYGPFPDANSVVGGYWMIRANSREEAIDWAKKVPAEVGDVIEVRQVFEVEDFPEDVQRAAESPIVEAAIEGGNP